MNSILDSMMTRPRAFFPESVTEYTALQLAKKLDDTDGLSTYLSLFDRHPLQVILEAFASAQAAGLAAKELKTAFEESLLALTEQEEDDAF